MIKESGSTQKFSNSEALVWNHFLKVQFNSSMLSIIMGVLSFCDANDNASFPVQSSASVTENRHAVVRVQGQTRVVSSVGHYSTQSSRSNTPATFFVALLKHAVTLLITLLRNSLLYSRSNKSNANFLVEKNRKKGLTGKLARLIGVGLLVTDLTEI